MYYMILIKDSMVLIHLAKISLLAESCAYFGEVIIPELVKKEVLNEKYPDHLIITELIIRNKIKVKQIKNKELIKKANNFNIYGGEAEAVALYWQENGNFIATDDDNVRKKKELLKLSLIGTPTIMLQLYQEKKINKEKLTKAIEMMKKIGWFNNTIWDKIRMEVEK